jgi:hypothetical protein
MNPMWEELRRTLARHNPPMVMPWWLSMAIWFAVVSMMLILIAVVI